MVVDRFNHGISIDLKKNQHNLSLKSVNIIKLPTLIPLLLLPTESVVQSETGQNNGGTNCFN